MVKRYPIVCQECGEIKGYTYLKDLGTICEWCEAKNARVERKRINKDLAERTKMLGANNVTERTVWASVLKNKDKREIK